MHAVPYEVPSSVAEFGPESNEEQRPVLMHTQSQHVHVPPSCSMQPM